VHIDDKPGWTSLLMALMTASLLVITYLTAASAWDHAVDGNLTSFWYFALFWAFLVGRGATHVIRAHRTARADRRSRPSSQWAVHQPTTPIRRFDVQASRREENFDRYDDLAA